MTDIIKNLEDKYDFKSFAVNLEETAEQQIADFYSVPEYQDTKVRIMEDAHAGAGCTVGFVSNFSDTVCCNLVGVDLGCGVNVTKYNFGCNLSVDDLKRLDSVIHKYVPSGFNVRQKPYDLEAVEDMMNKMICKDMFKNPDRIANAVGTLGSGNHFLEVDKGVEEGEYYLVIHSGSRNLGKQTAEIYQHIAEETCRQNVPKDLRYLSGQNMKDYLHDMNIAQRYACLNRNAMQEEIATHMDWQDDEELQFESVHNYIDVASKILRKGAIASYRNKKEIIPLNMSAGCIIGTGMSNPERLFSAPHGAGRTMSRANAFRTLDMDSYQDAMKGIYSTCVCANTLDEAPGAYKDPQAIIDSVSSTIDIEAIIKPVYNFKASESQDYRKNK